MGRHVAVMRDVTARAPICPGIIISSVILARRSVSQVYASLQADPSTVADSSQSVSTQICFSFCLLMALAQCRPSKSSQRTGMQIK
ncbi:hypothetical protein BaRGS_00008616 [Batillaria attramentaria]|uniref:Uncharacterized protein n=1 Tax=Batillaria attramentaria TaxID=370345 RepID=A0ABD0LKK9_9CAEN